METRGFRSTHCRWGRQTERARDTSSRSAGGISPTQGCEQERVLAMTTDQHGRKTKENDSVLNQAMRAVKKLFAESSSRICGTTHFSKRICRWHHGLDAMVSTTHLPRRSPFITQTQGTIARYLDSHQGSIANRPCADHNGQCMAGAESSGSRFFAVTPKGSDLLTEALDTDSVATGHGYGQGEFKLLQLVLTVAGAHGGRWTAGCGGDGAGAGSGCRGG